MADLKYFIRDSQRFRAGAGNVEERMIRYNVHLNTMVYRINVANLK